MVAHAMYLLILRSDITQTLVNKRFRALGILHPAKLVQTRLLNEGRAFSFPTSLRLREAYQGHLMAVAFETHG